MEAAAKPRGRRRQARKGDVADDGAAGVGGPPRVAAADATDADATERRAAQPKPSLSQRVSRSLRQLSNLGAGSHTEEPDEVEQAPGPAVAAAEPADARRADARHREGGDDTAAAKEPRGEVAHGLRSATVHPAALLGARLRALVPRAVAGAADWRALALCVLLAALVAAGAGAAALHGRASQRQLAVLQRQVSGGLEGAAAGRAQLRRELSDVAAGLRHLNASVAAAAGAQHQVWAAHSAAAARLEAELAAVRREVEQLRLAAAAAASGASAEGQASAAAGGPAGGPGGAGLAQLVWEQVEAALERFAADRTGLPDYALAAAGARVVAHSPAHLPPSAAPRLASLPGFDGGPAGRMHPHASKLLLAPIAPPGACLPLVGGSGWVDVRLARLIRPTAWTYEHIPASIAFDIRSAPRALALRGFLGPPPLPAGGSGGAGAGAGAGVLLWRGEYDAGGGRAVQTFALDREAAQATVDHVRLEVGSNHGQPGYTCLYRIRVHGVPA